jgi:hypothetical protein
LYANFKRVRVILHMTEHGVSHVSPGGQKSLLYCHHHCGTVATVGALVSLGTPLNKTSLLIKRDPSPNAALTNWKPTTTLGETKMAKWPVLLHYVSTRVNYLKIDVSPAL